MVTYFTQRRKAFLTLAGLAVNLLYVYNVTHPNIYVSALLAALTVLGVHQVPNEPTV